ncbi:MAG: hypothetical protein M0013_05710 [Actinomycetota bacterium]|nr:hypothetical protein [Actinomycetota bacterium]
MLDGGGHVLRREPEQHDDGSHWTFPKVRRRSRRAPEAAAVHEKLKETICRAEIVGHLPDGLTGRQRPPAAHADSSYWITDRFGQADGCGNATSGYGCPASAPERPIVGRWPDGGRPAWTGRGS